LDLLLRVLSVTKLVLAGVQTPNCIRATAYDAIALNYEVIVVSDATQASNQLVHEINLKDMENIGIGIMDTKSIIENLPNLPFKDLLGKLKEYLTGS